jgi:hypothetical protein
MPADDECRDDGLITTGRSAEEIDHRDLSLHRIPEPAVIRRVRVGAHERVIHDIIARVDLAMDLALIVIPNPSPPSGEHGLDAQKVFHLPGLEDPALRVDQRNSVAAELKPACEIGGIENPASKSREPVHVVESRLAQLSVVVGGVHLVWGCSIRARLGDNDYALSRRRRPVVQNSRPCALPNLPAAQIGHGTSAFPHHDRLHPRTTAEGAPTSGGLPDPPGP